MLEGQLADVNDRHTEAQAALEAANYELSQKDEAVQAAEEQIEKLEQELSKVQNARRAASESASSAAKGADAKKVKMIESLQKQIISLQQQMSKRSSAAQKLIQQRETECIELRKANKELQHEVDQSSLSDRKIFELAAQQSNRESRATAEIQMRDKMIAKLKEQLEKRDGELGSAQQAVTRVESQVEELSRVRRREDVNLDYLKSVVVQYLSKPPGSTEREALLSVLATLLQFDAKDYSTIEDGKTKVTWWGTVAPVLIGSQDDIASQTTSLAASFLGTTEAEPSPSAQETKTSI
mmetsp:Transcript_22534/g.32305  ORF Transcript_22534/g.32305 Transcript_22534/m.32305 type:complete len:296 (+) Transcript_22534:3-890(+)